MVVILQSAATVFWLEYRRYVRTRRYWALTLAVLWLGCALCTGLAILAARDSKVVSGLFGLSYSSAMTLGVFVWLPLVMVAPLTNRLLRDVYKTRTLTDLYLTELHPLGVVLGRIGAITALTGLALLTLTPAALWVCLLVGVPPWMWLASALLALAAYALGTAVDAYSLRGVHAPDESSLLNVRFTSFHVLHGIAPLGITAAAYLVQLIPNAHALLFLPLWLWTPYGAPILLTAAVQEARYPLLPIAGGVLSALGWTLWCALAAAQWREWWSESAYRLMRWGGAAFWLLVIGVHAGMLARVFATSPLAAERLLLLLLCLTTLANLSIGSLAGYFALARRPAPLRFALPYPFGGLLWQWALQWLSAGVLYLAIGGASGQWVAPEKWLLWSLYVWLSGTVLPQAIYSASWAFLIRYPTPLQGDYFNDFFINTRRARVYYETRASLTGQGVVLLFVALGVLLFGSWVVQIFNRALFNMPMLDALASGLLRLHPWWGLYQEWLGAGGGGQYVLYSLGWVILLSVWWGRLGLRAGEAETKRFVEWQRGKLN